MIFLLKRDNGRKIKTYKNVRLTAVQRFPFAVKLIITTTASPTLITIITKIIILLCIRCATDVTDDAYPNICVVDREKYVWHVVSPASRLTNGLWVQRRHTSSLPRVGTKDRRQRRRPNPPNRHIIVYNLFVVL